MATLNIKTGTADNPAVISGGTFDNLWGQEEQFCIIEHAIIDSPAPGQKPQIYGCNNLTFHRVTFRGIRQAPPPDDHVEGIHINGCQNILFNECLWDDNDVFGVFITVWGGYPDSRQILFKNCQFGSVNNGYYSLKLHDGGSGPSTGEDTKFEGGFRSGPNFWPADLEGAGTVKVVDTLPPFEETTEPPPVEPGEPPPTGADWSPVPGKDKPGWMPDYGGGWSVNPAPPPAKPQNAPTKTTKPPKDIYSEKNTGKPEKDK